MNLVDMKFLTVTLVVLLWGPFIYYIIKKVGGCGQMLTFAYKVGGWGWQNAYVIISF